MNELKKIRDNGLKFLIMCILALAKEQRKKLFFELSKYDL